MTLILGVVDELREWSMTVYVMGCDETRLVKIGYTKNVCERMRGIGTMSPYVMRLLWQSDPEHGEATERKLHEYFRDYRRHGEWFDFGTEDPVARVSSVVLELATPSSELDNSVLSTSRSRKRQLPANDVLVEHWDGTVNVGRIVEYYGGTTGG